ncbi:MAG TPA: hypothetical protein VLF69_04340 [Candidatus Saccharimonadales bacterium]|nr:hypothetical protein [Candidatus Saccharimonadales bacterium]
MKHRASSRTAVRKSSKLHTWLAYAGVAVLWMGTLIMSITGSDGVTTSKIKLSATQVHVINAIFALPALIILLAILFAALSIRRYAHAIDGSKESAGFRFVAYGIFALLAGLLIGSYIGGLRQLIARHAADPEHVKTTFVIISNYISAAMALVTYGLLLHGSQLLLRSIGRRLNVQRQAVPLLLAFGSLTVIYLLLIHGNPARQTSVDPGVSPTFGLPYWLTVLTVALPFVLSWLIGALALIGLHQYRQKTTGIVYKMLVKKFVTGMTLFIGLTIFLQLMTQLYNVYADSLSALLGIIVLVYLGLTYSFIVIALGAKRLNTIETLLIE